MNPHRRARPRAIGRYLPSLAGMLVLWLLWVGAAMAQAAPGAAAMDESGLPFIRNFTPAEYGGAPQNWALAQDRKGIIYVGNVEDGVLAFDGNRWRRIPVPDRATVRSLALGRDGRIYVGTVGNLGYLAPGPDGRLQFVSLLDRIPASERHFADVWQIFVTDEGIYFSTFSHLFRLQGDHVTVWKPRTSFHLAFHVGHTMYVREVDRGLMRLVGDQLQPVPGGERFAGEKIYALLPWHGRGARPGELLIGTRTQGWFLFDGQHYRRWLTQADAVIHQGALYGAIWLADGRLAVATLQGGLCLLDTDGHLLRWITRDSGLGTNVVFALFQDRQRGLWIAAGDGVSRITVDSPISHFGERSGLKGAVLAMRRYAGTLYVGTTEGLYRLDGKAIGDARFELIREVPGQSWSFAQVGSHLLVANNAGVFELGQEPPRLVLPTEQTVLSLLRSRNHPDRVFVGMQNGIHTLRLAAGQWIDEGPLADIHDEARTMLQTADGQLWLGAWNGGLMRLTLDADDRPGAARVERFSSADGLPSGQIQVVAIDGQPRFITMQGIYRHDAASGRFAPDPRFARLFPDGPRQIGALRQGHHGKLWMYTADNRSGVKEAGHASQDAAGRWHWSTRPLQPLEGSGIGTLFDDPDGVLWLGGDKGLFRYDPARDVPRDPHFGAVLREVASHEGRILFGGQADTPSPTVPYEQNALRFEFAAPSFDSVGANRFQVRLRGLDADWSPWSDEAYRDYTNLPAGSYRFEVRARNVYGQVGRQATFDFSILSPWYRTGWAWTLWLLLGALTLGGTIRWRSGRLHRRNRELEALVAQRTAQLLDANNALAEQTVTDPLTGLKNRRYLQQYLEHDVLLTQRHYRQATHRPAQLSRNVNLLFLMIDIDHFKQINDSHGHAAGDRVLEQFRDLLLAACRETDTPVRWGGEEFLVVARFTNASYGPLFAERIRALVAAHAFDLGNGQTLHRTCSIGFASYPFFPAEPDRVGWEQVVDLADECLYAAKHAGRNGWVGVEAGSTVPDGRVTALLRRSLDLLPESGPLRLHTSRAGESVASPG